MSAFISDVAFTLAVKEQQERITELEAELAARSETLPAVA